MKRLLLALGLSAALVGCTQKAPPAEPTAPEPAASAPPATATDIQPTAPVATNATEAAAPASTGTAAGKPIPARWKLDTNYLLVLPAQGTNVDAGQVEVIEFLWLGCPHCYELNPFVEAWKKKLPAYVTFNQVHITWDAGKTAHAKLFYTSESLGGDALVAKAFDEIHRKNNVLVGNSESATLQMQQSFAAGNGIDPTAYKREYNGFAVNTKVQRANQLMRVYRVDHVPVFIVNGKYRTDVGLAGGQQELMELLTDLAASEKAR